jgi:2-oxoglutarate ferredoxin oxidoreductase subunit delta
MPTTGRVEIDQERCKGCERCVAVCPRGLLQLANSPNRQGYHPAESIGVADQTKGPCTGCATCGIVCPEVAIAVYAGSGATGASDALARLTGRARPGGLDIARPARNETGRSET